MKKVYKYVHKKIAERLQAPDILLITHKSPNPTHPLKTAKNVKEHKYSDNSEYLIKVLPLFFNKTHKILRPYRNESGRVYSVHLSKYQQSGLKNISETPQRFFEIPQYFSEIPQKLFETPQCFSETPQRFFEIPQYTSEIPQKLSETPHYFSETPHYFSETPQCFFSL
jgi:hypothetical protein